MASQVPAALKSADISRFANRAAQLEKAKPIVAYWCEYWIVQQILSKGLHNADQECLVYTTSLMDKLEQFKSENATNDAVVDDITGKAYIEQFGLETFQRADNAVRASKASKQTADTFQASATFLELLNIWPPVDAEITAKIKFAKYHALRIAKALKAGEDPNLSNPTPEPEPEEALPPLDPNDADVQMLNGGPSKPRQPSVTEVPDESNRQQRSLAQTSSLNESLHPSREASIPRHPTTRARQASVVEVQDEAHKLQSNLARQSSIDESLHPSRAPSVPPPHDVSPLAPQDPSSFYPGYPGTGNDPVSPIVPVEERKASLGNNYFPEVPPPISTVSPVEDPQLDFPSAPSEPYLPQAPTTFSPQPPAIDTTQPPHQPGHQSPIPPSRHHGHFLPSTDPAAIPPTLVPQSAPRQPIPQAPPQLHQSPLRQGSLPPQPPPPHTAPTPRQSIVIDDQAMMKAQKHARWAISALNFEDVPTAIRELKGALETLGGS